MAETFSEIYARFLLKQESNQQDCFTAACILFLSFDHARVSYHTQHVAWAECGLNHLLLGTVGQTGYFIRTLQLLCNRAVGEQPFLDIFPTTAGRATRHIC